MFGLFGRWGSAETDTTRDQYWSAGFQIQNGAVGGLLIVAVLLSSGMARLQGRRAD